MSVLRWTIDNGTRALAFLKRRRRLQPSIRHADGRVCVNLGCGLAVAPGWINVDASLNAFGASLPRFVHPLMYRFSGASQYYARDEYCRLLSENRFVHHDLANSIPLVDATADVVYSSHFVEHLYRNDAERVLREAYRVLRAGGLIRVCIPDLAHAVSLYQAGQKRYMLEHFFFVEDRASFHARHKYMYDFELLAEALAAAGFRSIERREYRIGDAPDLNILDRYPEETLFVEARK